MTLPIIFANGAESWLGGLVCFGVFILVGCLVALSLYWEAQRRKALEQLAKELGLNFSPTDTQNIFGALAHTHLCSKGEQRTVANIIWGQTADTDVAIFDYTYAVESTNSSDNTTSTTYHRQTVVRFSSSDLNLPAFSLRPKNLFHRIGTLFGYQALTLDDYPTFSSRWLLRGQDEGAVRSLFSEKAVRFFEEERGLGVEGHNQMLIVYREDKRLAPAAIRAFLEESWQVFALFRTSAGERGL
jgi:hypothetical protein